MSAQNNRKEQPDFTTLTGIMNRFNQISYLQFQEDLNKWFSHNFQNPKNEVDSKFLKQLLELTGNIFKNADSMSR